MVFCIISLQKSILEGNHCWELFQLGLEAYFWCRSERMVLVCRYERQYCLGRFFVELQ